MQSLTRLMIVLATFASFYVAGCDGAPAPQTAAAPESSRPERSATSTESANRTGSLDKLRARADAAFAALGSSRRIRSESRIGPQPWPEDLPADWPLPDNGQLLADTRRDDLGRLLLVDLPDTPARALESFREALYESGFEARRPRGGDSSHALHVSRGELEAILTFVGRERTTRLEILFVCPQPRCPRSG